MIQAIHSLPNSLKIKKYLQKALCQSRLCLSLDGRYRNGESMNLAISSNENMLCPGKAGEEWEDAVFDAKTLLNS
jgi:hypothetical protein